MKNTNKRYKGSTRGKRFDTFKSIHSSFTGYLCALLNEFILISYRLYMDFICGSYSPHIALIYLSYRNRLKNAFLRSHRIANFRTWGENPRFTGKSPPRCPVFPE